MTEPKLPPLPEKSYLGDDASYGFDAEDMTTYATEAERLGYLRGLEEAADAAQKFLSPLLPELQRRALADYIRALAQKEQTK